MSKQNDNKVELSKSQREALASVGGKALAKVAKGLTPAKGTEAQWGAINAARKTAMRAKATILVNTAAYWQDTKDMTGAKRVEEAVKNGCPKLLAWRFGSKEHMPKSVRNIQTAITLV